MIYLKWELIKLTHWSSISNLFLLALPLTISPSLLHWLWHTEHPISLVQGICHFSGHSSCPWVFHQLCLLQSVLWLSCLFWISNGSGASLFLLMQQNLDFVLSCSFWIFLLLSIYCWWIFLGGTFASFPWANNSRICYFISVWWVATMSSDSKETRIID